MTTRLFSRLPEGRTRRVWMAQTALAWGTCLALAYLALVPSSGYGSAVDLAYDYVTARAFLEGTDFSSGTVAGFAERYLGDELERKAVLASCCPFPNAHPPALVLVQVPFALLPFPVVVAVWLLLNMLLLRAVGRWLGLSTTAALALAAWPPLFYLLVVGQYELLILFLVMAGWRAAKAGRDRYAGLWIGLAAVAKFYPGLFVIPFLLQRRFQLVASTCLVFLLGQVLGGFLLNGPAGLLRYYERLAGVERSAILPSLAATSPYTVLFRLLNGVDGARPLVFAPGFVWPITIGLALAGLLALARLRPEAAPVATLVALPNTTYYCTVLVLPQVVVLWRIASSHNHLRRRTLLGAIVASSLVGGLISMPLSLMAQVLRLPAQVVLDAGILLLAVQPIGYILLLVLSFLCQNRTSSAVDWRAKAAASSGQTAPLVE